MSGDKSIFKRYLYGAKKGYICNVSLKDLFGFFFKHITQPHCLFLQVANETRVSQEQTHSHKVRYSLRYLKFMWISNLLAGNDGKSPYSACISCSKWLWAHIGFFFLSLSQIKTAMLLKFEFEDVTGERCFGF